MRLAIVLAIASCGHSQATIDARIAPIDAVPDATGVDLAPDLEPIATQYGLPALAALAADEHTILGEGVTGVRKLGDPTIATLDDVWHLGSDTKAMTATLIARLRRSRYVVVGHDAADAFPSVAIDPAINTSRSRCCSHTSAVRRRISLRTSTRSS